MLESLLLHYKKWSVAVVVSTTLVLVVVCFCLFCLCCCSIISPFFPLLFSPSLFDFFGAVYYMAYIHYIAVGTQCISVSVSVSLPGSQKRVKSPQQSSGMGREGKQIGPGTGFEQKPLRSNSSFTFLPWGSSTKGY